MTSKEFDLGLRRKVAELDGWDNIETLPAVGGLKGLMDIKIIKAKDLNSDAWYSEIPAYELSLTEINLACDRHGIDFTLKTAWRPTGGYEFEAYEEASRTHAIGDTRAIALCNLFIAVMEGRLAINSSFNSESRTPTAPSESLDRVNSQISALHGRVDAMLDVMKKAVEEEIERLRASLNLIDR